MVATIVLTIVVLEPSAVGSAPPPLVSPGIRPNIIVILADDLDTASVQFMPLVKSLLADRGVRYHELLCDHSGLLPLARVDPPRAIRA